ncbi:uncharacterized protein N7525_001338 [Penicillium rubens]|uniref:uncharacterized protein n=1 Tax=Penicillium rubens TaxID=1108849 RepID=UPI002A5A8893|nr:uncharacterized protein N7525_001338 [Penicillium rubens]KAJ5843597.1 hypothetical protein N7525_001338 [Penicillium rubens]
MAISDKIGDKIRKGPFSHGLAPRDKFEPRLSHVSDVVELRVRDGKRKKARGLNYDLIEALELLRLRRSGYCSALGTLAQLITHEHKLEAIMELKDVQLPHVILEVARA